MREKKLPEEEKKLILSLHRIYFVHHKEKIVINHSISLKLIGNYFSHDKYFSSKLIIKNIIRKQIPINFNIIIPLNILFIK